MKLFKVLFVLSFTTFAMADLGQRAVKKADKFFRDSLTGSAVKGVIKAANARYDASASRPSKDAPADITAKDKTWRAWRKGGTEEAFIKSVQNNPCSDYLRKFQTRYKYVSEAFVMDKMGATVCVVKPTSDYDQGDEAKFQAPFNQGTSPHIGDAEKDESSGEYQVQVSYVIEDGGKKIGIMTVGVRTK